MNDTIDDNLEEATEIINENIGCYDVNITDARFLPRVKKLNNRMVTRMRQTKLAQGTPSRIPFFSPNDFLIERERRNLKTTGVILGFRGIGGSG